MKVLMTADAVGGVWTYALELARALAPHDVEIVLATMGARPTRIQRAAAAALPNVRLHESEYRLEWMDEPWDDVARAGAWLLELEARESPDIVQVNGYAHAALPWSAPAIVVAHSCSCSWWRAVRGEGAPSSWDRYRAAVRRGLDAASMVIAPTRAMLAALEREHGAVCASRVVRNARDPERFPPLAKEPFVLAAGRLWDEAKNVAALERVAPALPWPVRIAGETTMPGREPAAAARARHVGVLSESELARCMGHASIYALPARYEPFGLSALEAALAGCALVLGDLASLRELWDGAARFVAPNDDAALRAALSTLIADANERERVARRCRARALGYAPARMARGYLDAYGAVRASAHAEAGEGEGEGFACAS